MRTSIAYLLFGGLCLFQGIASAVVTVYNDEATYLNALASLGSSTLQESFENDAVWGVARDPLTAASVTSQGITWTTNHPATNEITTGPGPVRTGLWGVYDPDHGDATGTIAECDVVNPPEKCFAHDGFSGSIPSPDLIYGVGGYITGFVGADIDIIIDGIAHNVGPISVPGHHFMGVIDTAGFNTFEYRELEGQVEQQLFIFGDDFTIATSATTPDNNAPVANAGPDQTVLLNSTVTLDGSASSDVDGDPISFSWTLTVPAGSTASLSNPTAVSPSFTVDVAGTYTAQLVVNDGTVDSVPDTVVLTTSNAVPFADAGPDQTVLVNDVVTLDGTGSRDPDFDPLFYNWSIISKPIGSTTTLSNSLDAMPMFVVDMAGAYTVQLIVNDGQVDSAPDTVVISTANAAPVADAGPDQTALVNSAVTLSGSESTDADGDALTYSWSLITRPAGSSATLSNSTTVSPGFTVDVAGTYSARLVVNDGLVDSAPDTVTVSTTNSPPVADAGPDQTVLVNNLVTLNGNGSSDVDGDSLTYSWTLDTPAGSSASLVNPGAVMPNFTVDVAGTYTAQLVVNDGLVDSAPDTVIVSTTNSLPVANAGLDQTVLVNDSVSLNGSMSSDVDGDSLTYSWSLTTPAGSAAGLSNPTAVMPGFTVDVAGTYIAQLVVNDGLVDSAPDTVTISTDNSPPIANAGQDQAVVVNESVSLDGSASSDVDGDALTYSWSLSAPAGSSASLSNSATAMPSFMVDVAGTYIAQLVVNDGLVDSAPDTVTVSTLNITPVADAGMDQSANVNDVVTLDGTGSSDADGDDLSYLWSTLSQPAGSTASLSDNTASAPDFTVDVAGTYTFQLVVNDGNVDSLPDNVIVSTINVAPVANAGADQNANLNDTVTLDGSGSSDADGDSLTYRWSLTSKPPGSSASLSDPAAVTPTFLVDVAGSYTSQLVVNDGVIDSLPDTIIVNTANVAPIADAGVDQSVRLNDIVTLDGSGSLDANGDPLSYIWSFTSLPAGSGASLSDPTAVMPTFAVDMDGSYTLQLVVSDGQLFSAADSVNVTVGANVIPVADAGPDQNVDVDDSVTLDGTGSSDANGDSLTYAWSFTSMPSGSNASLSDTTAAIPSFTADEEGTYILQLVVNDGTSDSSPDTVSVEAKGFGNLIDKIKSGSFVAGNSLSWVLLMLLLGVYRTHCLRKHLGRCQ